MPTDIHNDELANSTNLSFLSLDWPCLANDIGSPYFSFLRTSATGTPIYGNADGVYLYWDASCDGYERPPEDQTPRWILDADAPNASADMDLDGDGQCSYIAHTGSFDGSSVPLGNTTWTVACDGAASSMSVAIAPLQALPTPAPAL